jgi:raffinose/stachyose/melibiose transport system substrate-binding protein
VKRSVALAAISVLALGMATRTAAWAAEVSFWTWRQEDKAAYTEMFADFTKLHPDITVRFQSFPDENYPTIVSTALAGGKGGDIIHAHAYGWLEQFVKSGYFLKLDRTLVPALDNMPTDAIASSSYRGDGQIYSVPFASQTLGLLPRRCSPRPVCSHRRPGTSSRRSARR